MIGIYALWFEESSMVYIGQSQDIEARYTEHLYKLRRDKHTNYKVQAEYLKYGEPELVVLEHCSLEESNNLEITWTFEFDSINKGLNLIEAGTVGYGVNSNNSKYSKIQILRVFSLLYRTDLTHIIISKKSKVHRSTISDIKMGKSHLWLKEDYSTKYKKMRLRKIHRSEGLKDYTIFISPEGVEYKSKNVRELARELYPDTWEVFRKGLSRIRTGKRNSYLGWKVKRP